MTENLARTEQKTAVNIFKDPNTVKKFEELLGKKANSFLTSVLSIVSQSDGLKNAEPNSVYLAAITSASLDLPINPNLGFAYIIPYNNKDGRQSAQFQIGYK
jgi:recombination protein RecT